MALAAAHLPIRLAERASSWTAGQIEKKWRGGSRSRPTPRHAACEEAARAARRGRLRALSSV